MEVEDPTGRKRTRPEIFNPSDAAYKKAKEAVTKNYIDLEFTAGSPGLVHPPVWSADPSASAVWHRTPPAKTRAVAASA